MRGGTVNSLLQAFTEGASITVVGHDFNHPYGELQDPVGHLTGRLADGGFVDAEFAPTEDYAKFGTIYLCPPSDTGECSCPVDDFRNGACNPAN